MDRDLYSRAKEVFLDACNLPPDERDAAIREACQGDDALTAEVQSLLAHHHAAQTSEDDPVAVGREPSLEAIAPVLPGYRILQEIGRGGMGVVYLALREGDDFRWQVAIKVLQRGMHAEQILHRFEVERQLLGSLNHPGVARLYDAGETEQGQPYFVMEYIDGLAIDRHCDTHRLTIRERLDLFRKVCAAVHYAHQNLVVHRDLKPANILVTKDGEVKLLDFGIAKVINPEFSFVVDQPTATEFRIMTPEYASPEQVRGEMVTTAGDVYSLGVLLYELLSGHRPYRLKSHVRAEVERVICDEAPERPSTAISRIEEVHSTQDDVEDTTRTITPESVSRSRESRPQRLRRALSGDIDNIVMKAMRKEPQRRYASAEQFGEDIRRHLAGLTVIARPDTASYRIAKFVRRHRAGVAVAAVIGVLVVGSAVGLTAAWKDAASSRGEADRLRGVLRLSASTLSLTHDFIAKVDGSLRERERIAVSARELAETLEQGVADNPELGWESAGLYDRIGHVLGGTRNPSLGGTDAALEMYRTAFGIRQELEAASPNDLDLQLELAKSHQKLGDMFRAKRELDSALTEFRTMLEISARVGDARPDDAVAKRLRGNALRGVGDTLSMLGQRESAIEYLQASLDLRRELVEANPTSLVAQRDLSVALLDSGFVSMEAGKSEESLDQYTEAVRIREHLAESEPWNDRARHDLARARYYLGSAYLELDRPLVALERLPKLLAHAEQRVAANPRSTRAKFERALRHDLLGQAYEELEDWANAKRHFNAFLEAITLLSKENPKRGAYRTQVAVSHERLAWVHASSGDRDQAIRHARLALAIYDESAARSGSSANTKLAQARVALELGVWLSEDGQTNEAIRRLDQAQSLYEELHRGWEEDAEVRDDLVRAHHGLTKLMIPRGDGVAARVHAERAVALMPEPTPEVLRDLAEACFLARDPNRAIEAATKALERLGEEQGSEPDALRRTLEENLARYRGQ